MKIILSIAMLMNLLFASSENDNLNSIYENIILKNSRQTLIDVDKLIISIQQNNFVNIENEFMNIIKSWKSVQGFYLLGDLDENYIDTPRYIDIFHEGNEDIKKQLDLILLTNEKLEIAHFKNSQKTINALEYMLFKKNLNNKRAKNIVLRILKTMKENFINIYNGYKKNQSNFVNNNIKANAMILNALIESSYKLKEWRVGDPAGLSTKFKKDPNNSRAEYSISSNSMIAIESILQTHLKVLSKQEFLNFGNIIKTNSAISEINDSIKYLNKSLLNTVSIKNDDFNQAINLYKSLNDLHKSYYITLIDKLKINIKILDSDGD